MIPIFVKKFIWNQSDVSISLNVFIPSVKSKNTSIVTAPDYIRVNCAPYIFEAFLWDKVDDEAGSCRIDETNEVIHFVLPKTNVGVRWDHLQNSSISKAEKAERKESASLIAQQREEKAAERKSKGRFERKQHTIRNQIRLDAKAKEKIEEIKENEKSTVLKGLSDWTSSEQEQPNDVKLQEPNTSSHVNHSAGSLPTTSSRTTEKGKAGNNNITGKKKNEEESCTVIQSRGENKLKENIAIWSNNNIGKEKRALKKVNGQSFNGSPIRDEACIPVTFTPRTFSTPARESTAQAEEEWLKKQTEARKASGFNDEDLREEEKNPLWLLKKGESLMKKGSWAGAVQAFNLGLKISPKMAELFVARAEAHFELNNLHQAAEDATEGLALLVPKVMDNVGERLRCHKVRGKVLKTLELYKEACMDFEAALALDPDEKECHETKTEIMKYLEDKDSSSEND